MPYRYYIINSRCCVHFGFVLFYSVALCLFMIHSNHFFPLSHRNVRLNSIRLVLFETSFNISLGFLVYNDYLLCQQFALITSEQWACITSTSKKTEQKESSTTGSMHAITCNERNQHEPKVNFQQKLFVFAHFLSFYWSYIPPSRVGR